MGDVKTHSLHAARMAAALSGPTGNGPLGLSQLAQQEHSIDWAPTVCEALPWLGWVGAVGKEEWDGDLKGQVGAVGGALG